MLYLLFAIMKVFRYLFLAHNHLTHIDISLEGIFPDLESLHIAGNRMNSWECLDRLNDLPALTSLRMYNIPYYDDSAPDPAIRRLLCIARSVNSQSHGQSFPAHS